MFSAKWLSKHSTLNNGAVVGEWGHDMTGLGSSKSWCSPHKSPRPLSNRYMWPSVYNSYRSSRCCLIFCIKILLTYCWWQKINENKGNNNMISPPPFTPLLTSMDIEKHKINVISKRIHLIPQLWDGPWVWPGQGSSKACPVPIRVRSRDLVGLVGLQ